MYYDHKHVYDVQLMKVNCLWKQTKRYVSCSDNCTLIQKFATKFALAIVLHYRVSHHLGIGLTINVLTFIT